VPEGVFERRLLRPTA
jgi:hypothetical protein